MNFRRGLKRRGVSAAIDITPLVDVVFNLLIFLLISTTFKSQEQAFSIVLPVGDQKTEVTKVRRPTVFVTREGEYLLYEPGADRAEPVEGRRFLSTGELSVALERLARESGKDTAVNIKGDATASYQRILDVVNECRRHGLNRVFFPYKVGERQP
jgi:biopolymer transport protein ExbD